MPEIHDPEMESRVPDWLKADPRFRALAETHDHPGRAAAELGIETFQGGDAERAAEIMNAAVTISPLRALYWGNYGVVLNALGQREKAVAMFNRSLALDGDQFQVWLNLANTLAPLGHSEEAAEAFEQATRHRDTAPEAYTGLGLLGMAGKRYSDAAKHLKRAVEAGANAPMVHANLGAAAFQTGNAETAATAYAAAAELAPGETGYTDNAAFLAMLAGVIKGKAEEAVTAFAKPLEDDTILLNAFRRGLLFLNAYSPTHSQSLVKEWLDYYPDDPEARYINAILSGRKPAEAPHAYITRHFDELADRYDDAFLADLSYSFPRAMSGALAQHLGPSWKGDVLDIGCGRGALAPFLEAYAETLTGVDLSPRMIEHAGARVLYDELAVSDFMTYMDAHPEAFDLVAAGDALIYSGDLNRPLDAAVKALRQGGLIVFSKDIASGGTYQVRPSGRFQHTESYVRAVAARHFEIIEIFELDLRRETGSPVRGLLSLLAKP